MGNFLGRERAAATSCSVNGVDVCSPPDGARLRPSWSPAYGMHCDCSQGGIAAAGVISGGSQPWRFVSKGDNLFDLRTEGCGKTYRLVAWRGGSNSEVDESKGFAARFIDVNDTLPVPADKVVQSWKLDVQPDGSFAIRPHAVGLAGEGLALAPVTPGWTNAAGELYYNLLQLAGTMDTFRVDMSGAATVAPTTTTTTSTATPTTTTSSTTAPTTTSSTTAPTTTTSTVAPKLAGTGALGTTASPADNSVLMYALLALVLLLLLGGGAWMVMRSRAAAV
jgi:hypothetical protein